jgi:hypothetical protein
MKNIQAEAGLLINEWQLGSQLNVAVTNGTRNKFNLLLSLLSDDARDFSQFDLPKATIGSLSEMELRESFSLSEAQPLVNQGHSLQQAKNISLAVHKKDISSIRLQSLLNNEAILSRTNNTNFDSEVVDNLSFLSQRRLKESQALTKQSEANGVDYALLKKYQDLNFDEKPVRLRVM